MKKILSALILFIVLAGCACKTVTPKTSEDWRHEIEYSRKGTKSEARHGYLYYKNKPIPDCFASITIPGETYTFFSRDTMWGDDGYFATDKPLILMKSKEHITDKIKANGYYLGLEKLEGTPAYWVYLQWDGGDAYADPVRLDDLINREKLKVLPRDTLFDVMKP